MASDFEIVLATTAVQVVAVRELFREYANTLGIDLCFQNFAQELATLPGSYAGPNGRLLIARLANRSAGCVALRPMDAVTGEIKRLYVPPEFRRRGFGRALVERVITEARGIGYRRVRLDTLREMTSAVALYVSVGFKEVAPYRPGEPEGISYFELDLRAA